MPTQPKKVEEVFTLQIGPLPKNGAKAEAKHQTILLQNGN